jgi:hypothetical protein
MGESRLTGRSDRTTSLQFTSFNLFIGQNISLERNNTYFNTNICIQNITVTSVLRYTMKRTR